MARLLLTFKNGYEQKVPNILLVMMNYILIQGITTIIYYLGISHAYIGINIAYFGIVKDHVKITMIDF